MGFAAAQRSIAKKSGVPMLRPARSWQLLHARPAPPRVNGTRIFLRFAGVRSKTPGDGIASRLEDY